MVLALVEGLLLLRHAVLHSHLWLHALLRRCLRLHIVLLYRRPEALLHFPQLFLSHLLCRLYLNQLLLHASQNLGIRLEIRNRLIVLQLALLRLVC